MKETVRIALATLNTTVGDKEANIKKALDTIDDAVLVNKISAAALDCFDALGCRHFARADFILSNDGTPFILEVNTIPGFTSHSLLPMAAAKAGLSMRDLCTKIIEAAYSSLVNHQA